MKKGTWILFYILFIGGVVCLMEIGSRTVTVMVESAPISRQSCIIVDPGHGGEDGGATSCTGILESAYNLSISMRLNDLLHLLGYDTKLIRASDTSIYTQGKTIAQKKVSDLKERVRTKALQSALTKALDPGSNRTSKKSSGVYLMEHIKKPGVLIECGFLSNPAEEAKLRDKAYQQKLCCVIAATVSQFLKEHPSDSFKI